MEIEIISRESIKPSSPTPRHLRTLKLSLLDQILPPYYHPAVLYFLPEAADSLVSQRGQILKQALSLNLTRFYPFAGTLGENFSVDCNDEGVPFVVATVKGNLVDFLKNPDLHLVQHFLPGELSWTPPGSNVAMIQVNKFDCNGMVIAVIVCHAVADGVTLNSFLKFWAATARRSNEAVCPNYLVHSLFPQNDTITFESSVFSYLDRFLVTGNYVLKRYIFDASAISTLKAKSRSSNVEIPTRIEVVTAFIWKCFVVACAGVKQPSLMNHSVNLRSRADPPLAENCFGNFFWFAAAQVVNEAEPQLKDLVSKVRESKQRFDADFVGRMQGDQGWIGYLRNAQETKTLIPEQEANCLYFSSWCKFGVYEVDFGWGKPIWACNSVSSDSYSPKLNNVMLMDTKCGDGIEAWVTIEEQYAALFQENEELLNLSLIDPSPLGLLKIWNQDMQ